jgi:4-diphosphocytidyl-2-C-methyl-D-erythritol kinase
MNTTTETLPCYGKINLFLEVHDKRSDGYHALGTLFHTVRCHDLLHAEEWNSLELICPSGITADPKDNLVLKAARLMREAYADRLEPKTGIRFTLEKNLPSGAGLGGGSSNAAAALLLCNRIWKLGLTIPELIPLAAKLGADVPFFLYGGSSFGEGKGEILMPAPDPYPFHIVIGTPHCRVETGWAYEQLEGQRKREWSRFKALYFTYFEDWQFYQVLRNNFDEPMRQHFPPIQSLYDSMQTFSPAKTLLCGSGASVFSLFQDKATAQRCLEAIQSTCRFSCLTEFVN